MPATNARTPTVRWIVRSLSSALIVSALIAGFLEGLVGRGMAITVGRTTDKTRRLLHPRSKVAVVTARKKFGSQDKPAHTNPPIGVR